MKTWGSGGIALLFLTQTLDVGAWCASRPGMAVSFASSLTFRLSESVSGTDNFECDHSIHIVSKSE
jgi:hypothetical protein